MSLLARLSSVGKIWRPQGSAVDKSDALAEAMVVTIRQPLLVLDKDLRVEKANPAYLRLFASDKGPRQAR
jgi:hypothetical protein